MPNRKPGRLSPAAFRILASLSLDRAAAGPAALFLLCGVPGAGKTTFAAALAALTGATVIESDRVRRELFGTPVFSSRESGILFRGIRSAMGRLIAEGRPVILDATNVDESDRRPFYAIADEAGLPLHIIALEAPETVIEQRLRDRALAAVGYSYADLDVYHRMRARAQPISRPHWRIDTSDGAATEAALTAIVAEYRKSPQLSDVSRGWGARGTSE